MRCCGSALSRSGAAARERVSCLLCELVWRQRAVGMIEDNAIRLPLTQTELTDALGLTPLYVNRILQAFRREQLIILRERRLVLHAPERLQAISELTPEYLQLSTTPGEIMHYFDPLGLSGDRLHQPKGAERH